VSEVIAAALPAGGQYEAMAIARERYARIVASGGFAEVPRIRGKWKVGQRHPEIPALRMRLAQEGYDAPGQDTTLTAELETAIRAFQSAHQLKAHGRLDKPTLKELSVAADVRLAQIDQALVAWRRAPDRTGRFIQVNVADFHGELWNGANRVHRFRIIVGSPRAKKRTDDGLKLINATPMMSAAVDRVIYNPFWNIPARILNNEIVPKELREAPAEDRIAYLSSKGYQVRSKVEGEVANVRQPPGPGNALGRVKFIFPNRHDVYLHDTPGKHLFSQPRRAFSHGCMRVHKPLVLARMILEGDGQFDEARIDTVLRRRTNHRIYLNQKVLIHIEYYTVRVDEAGLVHFLRDVYRRHG
jgi:murein L,D-transpeptidase YcbB/YkuD